MGGFEVARWREKICCVIPKRVAGVGFATFMESAAPLGGARRVVLVGSGEGGECLICSTFYSVLGQGLGADPDHLGGSGGHSPIMVRFRCFLSCVAVAAAFGWQGQ